MGESTLSTIPTRGRRGAFFAVLVLGGVTFAAPSHAETFAITLTNLTNPTANSGQPFSVPIFTMHSSLLSLWEMDGIASPELNAIAQDADNTGMLSFLSGLQTDDVVSSVVTPTMSALLPGQSVSFTITTDAAHPFLSSVWMLGRTNDGFAGNNALNLFDAVALGNIDLFAFDAGSEVNNEDALFLPALGGTLNDPESGLITLHTGIRGDADAPASWNWTGAVARVSVTAVVPEASSALLFAGASLLGGVILSRRARRNA